MEKTQEELLKETGGVMTSITARGSQINKEELTKEEMEKIVADSKKQEDSNL